MATLALFVALGGTGYAATTIVSSQIAKGAVTTPKLASGAVTAPKLATGAVTSAKLAKASVNAAKLANRAVTTDKLAAGAVGTDKLAARSVGLGQIAPASLDATIFAAGKAPGINQSKIGLQVRTLNLTAPLRRKGWRGRRAVSLRRLLRSRQEGVSSRIPATSPAMSETLRGPPAMYSDAHTCVFPTRCGQEKSPA